MLPALHAAQLINEIAQLIAKNCMPHAALLMSHAQQQQQQPLLQHVAVASGCCTFIERLLAVRALCNPNEVSNDNACHPPSSPKKGASRRPHVACCMLPLRAMTLTQLARIKVKERSQSQSDRVAPAVKLNSPPQTADNNSNTQQQQQQYSNIAIQQHSKGNTNTATTCNTCKGQPAA